jgi:hypothetical protein
MRSLPEIPPEMLSEDGRRVVLTLDSPPPADITLEQAQANLAEIVAHIRAEADQRDQAEQ